MRKLTGHPKFGECQLSVYNYHKLTLVTVTLTEYRQTLSILLVTINTIII